MIPSLEKIIGPQPAVPQLGPSESQNRFNRVFQQFIHVFSQPQHPLVIFLDDLQWADLPSLKLMELIVTDADSQYLLLIGAYRDNEVSPTHPLIHTLEQIEKNRVTVNNIILKPLDIDHVNELVADTLHSYTVKTLPLAELVYQKTQGNPFFLTQLLKSLYQNNFLIFDFSSRTWQWEIDHLQEIDLTDNVVELMVNQIQKLSPATQNVLKLAACIGDKFTLEILALVSEQSSLETAQNLWESLQLGFVLPLNNSYKIPLALNFKKIELAQEKVYSTHSLLAIAYKFLHDRVQQAAYSLIPDDKKKQTHFKIGQLLLQNTTPEDRRENIFALVNQLNYGTDILTSELEKYKLADLNLIAGQKAKAATAHESAVKYLQVGLELLASDSWNSQYELTLALHEEAAEAAFLSGDFDRMQRFIEIVQNWAKTLLDKVKVYEVQIQAYISQNRLLEAVNTALQVLKLLGVEFPQKPNPSDIGQALEETGEMLSGTRIEDLVDLPQMSNPYKLAAMKLMSSIFAAAYVAAPELMPLTVCKQVHLSVEYGNASVSPFAYANYGLLLCGMVGDIDSGYQFGQLALSLVSKLNAKEIKAKTVAIVNIFIQPWKKHLRETLEPFLSVYASGMETGDLEWAAFGLLESSYFAYLSGKELTVLERDMARNRDAIHKIKQKTALHYIEIYWQVTLNLLGKSKNLCRLKGEACDEQLRLPLHQQAKDTLGVAYIYWNKLLLSYWFENYSEAIENTVIAEKYLDVVVGLPLVPLFHFYDSLVRLAVYVDCPESEQQGILHKVQANQEKMQKWADHAPMNHLHKFYLVEAERHRVLGEKIEAIEMYDDAIALAKENEYINEEALAHELAAKFYLSWGKQSIAQTYMTNAYYAYVRWGAKAKVGDLEERYPQILSRIQQREHSGSGGQQTSAFTTKGSEGTLDLATVMKASQALSGEIVLDTLIDKLMKIAMENAGATKGFLMLEKDGLMAITATATVHQHEFVVQQSSRTESNATDTHFYPASIINYVTRTQKNVVLKDASYEGIFTVDPYVVQTQPKSVLCTPLIHQGKLIGLLYLENNLTSAAFTPERVEVLRLLTSQIAIALENALLIANLATAKEQVEEYSRTLEAKVEERTWQLKAKEASLAEAQKLAHLGSWELDGNTLEMTWSDELLRIFGLDPEQPNPTLAAVEKLIHPDDFQFCKTTIEQAIALGED